MQRTQGQFETRALHAINLTFYTYHRLANSHQFKRHTHANQGVHRQAEHSVTHHAQFHLADDPQRHVIRTLQDGL